MSFLPPLEPLPQSTRAFTTRLALSFVLLATILLAVGVRVWQTSDRASESMAWVAHTYQVKQTIAEVLTRHESLQADAIAYAATGDPLRLKGFDGRTPALDTNLDALINLVHDNAHQVEAARDLKKTIDEQCEALGKLVDARRKSGVMPPIPDLGTTRVSAIARALSANEDALLVERQIFSENAAGATRWLTAAAIGLSLLFLAVTFVLVYFAQRRNSRSHAELLDANARIAEALDETRRMSESMHKLAQFGEILQSCRSLDEVRGGLGSALAQLLPNHGGRLALINPSQNLAAIGAHWGRHALLAESVFAPEDCWALRRGQAYPLAGTNAGFSCQHVHWPADDAPGASYLCVPLAAQGEVVGVLTFDAEKATTPGERRIALAAGEQLALALANLRLQETLRTQSIRDPLTGLFNRRYLEVSLERELLRASRRSLPLTILMLDIDHFKRFNDSHGHDAGDALLAKFAEVVLRSVRNEDVVCRYGGEEFTVLLLEADAPAAARCAEIIRSAVAAMSIEHRQVQLPHVSVSIGLSVFPHDGRGGEALLRRADTALYAAKKNGRNRVIAAATLTGELAPS